MILLDNNQIILANMFHALKVESEINEDLLRHLVLNSYRLIRKSFVEKYGEIVICHDSSNSWRKQYFPEYKANRTKMKEKSNYDWDKIYSILNSIRDEISNIFPYKNMKVESCEADDIIAILAKHLYKYEKIVIVSNDKDFQQLQRYPNICQYSNLKREMISCEKPDIFLLEHILRGDSGDGIPNVISDDDSFVDDEKRQNRLTKKIMNDIVEGLDDIKTSKYARNWQRNETLINFDKIPNNIESSILDEWNKPMSVTNRSKILPYMITKRLKNLIENIEEF